MTTFWSGFDTSARDADLTSPDTDILLSMWNTTHQSGDSPSNSITHSDHTPVTLQPILNTKSRKRIRDANNPRTKVACTACYLSKSCCDQARPCGRCVRLNRPEQCQDRVHKKRTVNTGSRSGFSKTSSSSSKAITKIASTTRTLAAGGEHNDISPSSVSVEIMSGLFSQVLADLWIHQCQIMMNDAMPKGDQIYVQTVRRIEKVTLDLSGLVNGPVYLSIRQRLYDMGIQVSSRSIQPMKRPPFYIITAQQAQEHDLDHENIAIIKSVQLPGLLVGPNPRRGLYINEQAQRLFGYTAAEFCDLFNRVSSDHAFAPFWIWIISQPDWVHVIRHNSLFFLSEDEPLAKTKPKSESKASRTSDDDNTLIVTCIDKHGRTRKCLASTRSCIVSPRSYSFCFIALGND